LADHRRRSAIDADAGIPTAASLDIQPRGAGGRGGRQNLREANLHGNRILELPFDAPIKNDFPQVAPEVFHYLGGKPAAAASPPAQEADVEAPEPVVEPGTRRAAP
jgi:hypothetical protein